MTRDFQEFIVTEDAELTAQLWARFESLGSRGLAEYAHSLGLFPPGYREGHQDSICEYGPPGHEGRGFLVWESGLDSPSGDDQEREEYSDDDDPWAGLVDTVQVPRNGDGHSA